MVTLIGLPKLSDHSFALDYGLRCCCRVFHLTGKVEGESVLKKPRCKAADYLSIWVIWVIHLVH